MMPARQVVPVSPHVSPQAPPLAKRFRAPDQLLAFENGRLDVLSIDGATVAKGSFAPGWRWSQCVRPAPMLARRPASYVGLVLSGRVGVRTSDGESMELASGDLFQGSLGAEDEAWVIGYQPCEILYVRGAEAVIRRLEGRA